MERICLKKCYVNVNVLSHILHITYKICFPCPPKVMVMFLNITVHIEISCLCFGYTHKGSATLFEYSVKIVKVVVKVGVFVKQFYYIEDYIEICALSLTKIKSNILSSTKCQFKKLV